ncbi:MAG TPA: Hint domain-containing protein [Pirellulaceae bacterium]|nr:Hint domain-containing protein [Pirellulaceae bacterium]HMO93509.1 Hint domain-containing protein [Pirellulaceae bacterium]HMP70414.1 Hint domain-containing protein [Pirellulaceae bacterium]
MKRLLAIILVMLSPGMVFGQTNANPWVYRDQWQMQVDEMVRQAAAAMANQPNRDRATQSNSPRQRQEFVMDQNVTREEIISSRPAGVNVARISPTSLDQYRIMRDQAGDTFEDHWQLAEWCRANRLEPQERAHLRRALLHQPTNETVHERLGHINVNGQWYTTEQVKEEIYRSNAAADRLNYWSDDVSSALPLIKSHSKDRREVGWIQLNDIDDPGVITALETMVLPINQKIGVQALGLINRFDVREASESLLRTALSDAPKAVRNKAVEYLAERNVYDFVPELLGQMVTPISVRYAISPDRFGNANYRFVMFQRSMDIDRVEDYSQDLVQVNRISPLTQMRFMNNSNQRARIAMSNIEQVNQSINARNREIQNILYKATGANPGNDPESWWAWWYGDNDMYIEERPTEYSQVEMAPVTVFNPTIAVVSSGGTGMPGRGSECLVAGTLIWTERGKLPIEELVIGDLVLCRKRDSMELEYQVVLQQTRRPATPTLKIMLPESTIQSSGGHYFWIDGLGWTRARDLTAGMAMLTADGNYVLIREIEPAEPKPLFNLIVDGNANYLVGDWGILSHDGTMPYLGSKSLVEIDEPMPTIPQGDTIPDFSNR